MILATTAAGTFQDAPVTHAIDEARRRGARLVVVHVVAGPAADDDHSLRRWRSTVAAWREQADRLRERLRELDVDGDVEVIPTGSNAPSDAILQRAKESEVELIVIGVRQRSRVGKALMGSTAQDVLLRADCPVLAVPIEAER
jgi:nucleotide-binding universal stress UspA family protein